MTTIRRGMALVLVLFHTVILLMLVASLLILLRGEVLFAQDYRDGNAALYIAESGLVQSIEKLGLDSTWNGVENQELLSPSGERVGLYTVKFRATAPFSDTDSVNNLAGLAPLPSYRGADSVPPGCALVTVTSRVGLAQRKVEALLSKGFNLPPGLALGASGKIKLRGEVHVWGRADFESETPIMAGLHSNSSANEAEIVSWAPQQALDRGVFEGRVTSSSPHSQSVKLASGAVDLGTGYNQPQRVLPNVNIVSAIEAHKSAPPPALPSNGSANLGGGRFYQAGDVEIFGDLKLNDTTLYVKGNLVVHGSISGGGTVYVGKSSSLYGDATVYAGKDSNVALMSQGSIDLKGFDGTAYLDGLAVTRPALKQRWDSSRSALEQLRSLVANYRANPVNDTSSVHRLVAPSSNAQYESWLQVLGGVEPSVPIPSATGQVDQWRELKAQVALEPAGPTRDFMVKKLEQLGQIFDPSPLSSADEWELSVQQAARNKRMTRYSMYRLNKDAATPYYQNTNDVLLGGTWLRDNPATSVGSASFQGLLYSHGAISASHEVRVLGAVVALDDGSQSTSTVDSEVVEPGQISFKNGSQLIYLEKPLEQGLRGDAPVSVLSWLNR